MRQVPNLLSAIQIHGSSSATLGVVSCRMLRGGAVSAGYSCISAVLSNWSCNRGSALTIASQLPHDYREHVPNLILNTKRVPFN